jgi:CheY-like chemotaxis protein
MDSAVNPVHPSLPPCQEYVVLQVSDTGCGMDELTRERIFEPFFTTKFTGRGLGLSAVFGIVRSHKGVIAVTSAPQRGTTFQVFLPALAAPVSEAAAESEIPLALWRGKGTILVVDDEKEVRRFIALVLSMHGFTVLQASNPRESVEIVRSRGSEVCLVVLDLDRPWLDGERCLDELHRAAPNLPVVLMSGNSTREMSSHQDGKGVRGFLQKPFSPRELTTCVRAILPG